MAKEITFLVYEAEEGGCFAEAANVGIFAEADTITALKENIRSGIACFYEDAAIEKAISFFKEHAVDFSIIKKWNREDLYE